jgi:hypothetical protein
VRACEAGAGIEVWPHAGLMQSAMPSHPVLTKRSFDLLLKLPMFNF